MKEYWKQRLSPWDAELMMMVESITGKKVEPRNGGNCYFFEADYELHNDPEYINALWEAIDGRAGQRLVSMNDDAEAHCLRVYISFSKEALPLLMRVKESKANPLAGKCYINEYGEILFARKVDFMQADALAKFIGNGEFEVPEEGRATFHFLNANGSVFSLAAEGQYIVFLRFTHFVVVEAEKFEKEYHLFE